jgi:putative ABC transport system permease protein
MTMWKNYWTVAVRALAKNKTYSVINVAGLAIGMAACIIILLYVRYERSYDGWIPGVENIYQLQTWRPKPKEGEPVFVQMAPMVTKARILKDFPQVESAVYMQGTSPVVTKDGQASSTEDYLLADDDPLKVIPLPLAAGTSLRSPQTVLLTQSEARRRFRTENAVGRTLTMISQGVTRDFKVVGILKDLPKNSHIKANAILRLDFNSFYADNPGNLTCWGCWAGWVYAKLKPGTDVAALQAQMPAWEKRNIPDEFNGTIRSNRGDDEDWHFINLKDIHLGRAQGGAMTPGNDKQSIVTFAVIALLILGMAVVNFTNLATARAGQRAREVALRKVLGAARRQLITQFIAEALLIAALSMLLALALVELLIKPFAAFLDAGITLHYFGSDGILLPALGLTLVVGVLSGIYPAFFLSRFQPAQVLKANRSSAETPGTGRIRTVLVVLQFAVSIGLIICTAVIYGQTVFARSADPGFKRDHIIQVEELSRAQLFDKGETVVEQMKRVPGVVAVGRGDLGVDTDNISNTTVIPPGTNEEVKIGSYSVDEGYFDAMGLKLVAGRWFDPGRPMDDMTLPYPSDENAERALAARGVNVVINQLAVKDLGFKSPQDAVGKVVKSELFSPGTGMVNINIIGVVGDSRFRSVRTPIDPMMFENVNQGAGILFIRYNGNPSTVRDAVERQWKRITTEVPFTGEFSEDVIRELYEAEDARAEIFAAFSILAVIIGCLGLFGLAAFTAERRTKEIGIRKVLGARTRDIVRLLVWQFSRPVLVANLIAWPVAWWMMRGWLNTFDERIALGPVPFVAAALIALAIAVATVVAHSIRVARANPIHALRYE